MRNLIVRSLSSLILLPIIFYLITNSLTLKVFTIICFFISCYEWSKMNKNYFYKISGYIFLSISFMSFFILAQNILLVFFILTICISTDIGGYVVGKLLNGPKLTKISPNKTYSGMLGGYFFSIISLYFFSNFFVLKNIPFYKLIMIVIIISTVSQIGDLIISFFKRKSKIKNTGNLIPGHGGLLDRIDGMIFVFPTFYLIYFIGIFQL